MKHALITGIESNRISRSLCAHLLQAGYQVIATWDVSAEGKSADAPTRNEFPTVQFESVDFRSLDSLQNLVSLLASERFDLIVNCSATLAIDREGHLRDESVRFDLAEFDRVVRSNVTSVAALCLGLSEQINAGGSIVNVTSSAAGEGAFATISYNASRAAVESLTKSLASSMGSARGIRVNSIAPGWIPPVSDAAGQGVIAVADALTPSYAVASPDDIVRALDYLLSAPFQNGSVIQVDGGIVSSYLPYMLESLELAERMNGAEIQALADSLGDAKRRLRGE